MEFYCVTGRVGGPPVVYWLLFIVICMVEEDGILLSTKKSLQSTSRLLVIIYCNLYGRGRWNFIVYQEEFAVHQSSTGYYLL
jgi:hypothetical protein